MAFTWKTPGNTWSKHWMRVKRTWRTHGTYGRTHTEWTWKTHGIHMVYIWNTHGIHVAYIWDIHEYIWNTHE